MKKKIFGGKIPGTIFLGGSFPGSNFPRGNFPKGNFPRGKFLGERGSFPGVIFRIPSVSICNKRV